MSSSINLLIVVRREHATRYFQNLSALQEFRVRLVTDVGEAKTMLTDKHADVLVLDNELDGSFQLISYLRQAKPSLLIVSVDEEADFAIPGLADDISTTPFIENDLARRIHRLMSDRRLETLRADSMPPVREVAKKLRRAEGEIGKIEATVSACRDLNYDYVAFYRVESLDPLNVSLKAQDGLKPLQAAAPKTASLQDVIGLVAQTGQSRIAVQTDDINHPFVSRGKLGSLAGIAIGVTNRYGVLLAARERPNSISQQDVMMLELLGAQLAAVIAKA